MRIILSFLSVILMLFVNAQKRKFSVQIYETRSYCGGAVPTEAVTAELNKKIAFAHKTIYVYKKGKCIDSCKTDSAGNASFKLKLGKYDLYLPWKHFRLIPMGDASEYNADCLVKEWKKADAILEIKRKGNTFSNYNIGHQFCPWQYNCLNERHIPPTAPKQN